MILNQLDLDKDGTVIKILAISGSLRVSSSNTTILRALIALAPEDTQIEIYDGIGKLPHFNPELDGEGVLLSVQDWRSHLTEADAIVFCTPEYAHGVPGVLKNALDWIVSSGEFIHKPTAVISASPSIDGGAKANASLVQTLRVMMAEIEEESILCIPTVSAKLNQSGDVIDLGTARSLQYLLANLHQEVSKI
jgi:chromate reductase, NAD(P)H dehydrogenase (quinone)